MGSFKSKPLKQRKDSRRMSKRDSTRGSRTFRIRQTRWLLGRSSFFGTSNEKSFTNCPFSLSRIRHCVSFDSATSHAVYAKNALRVNNISKGGGNQQSFLRPWWYRDLESGAVIEQQMWSWEIDSLGEKTRVQKGIQRVLEERGLWPDTGLRLEYAKPKCPECQDMSSCRMCVKGNRCASCKEKRQHSGDCSSQQVCNARIQPKERCRCVRKECLDAVRKGQKNVLRVRNYPAGALRTVSFFFFFLSLLSRPQAILIIIQIVAQGDY